MSSEDIEEYKVFIENLIDHELRPAALNDIKSFFELKPAGKIFSIIRRLGISKIVHCLDTTDKTQINLTCEALKKCFEKFEPGDIIQNYPTYFMYLLRHEAPCVQELAVSEVNKAITANINILCLPQFIDVFVAVAQLVFHKDVGLANKAILVTSNLLPEAYPKVLEEMQIGLYYPSSGKCNVLEVIVNISTKSHELFQLCVEQKYISFMISELTTDDFLYQINILELLSQLAIKPYGINHLVECGALQKIVDLIEDLENHPLKNLLIPGYMRFFGSVAYHYPKYVLDKYPILIELLFNALESKEQVILLIALDTLGFIGATNEGKMCLAALEWFRALKQSESTVILFDICKNPFPDIKLAGFILLDAICQHRWGEEMVASVAGFIEYLLDRPMDFTKEEKEAKYNIIKRLTTSTVFDPNIIYRLQTYVEQGPCYKDTIMEVALEEQD